jgi:uncharacterized protein YigE (DUF2233 family)
VQVGLTRILAIFLPMTMAIAACERPSTSAQSSRISAQTVEAGGQRFRVLRVDPKSLSNLRLCWRDDDGSLFGNPARLSERLGRKGERVIFATNAGIFDPTRKPVGLHIENGEKLVKLNQADGTGNFFLKPNGVFFISKAHARICESGEFPAVADQIQLATQSGPLLVRGGKEHPAFDPNSTNRKIRSGVGVTSSGDVYFVLSEERVTFHELAALFRDRLGCSDALYLDGEISKFYGPAFGWNDGSGEFAGMLAIVEGAK